MFDALFITGMARSGTSLVDKIVGAFEDIESFSQPLPFLLTTLKADFLRSQGVTDQRLEYPLADQQFGNFFDHHDLTRFLNNQDLGRSYLESILSSMDEYSGQYFKPKDMLSSLFDWQGGTLSAFVKHYFTVHRLAVAHRRFAWKETVAEEFVPYFIGQGFLVLLVVRDPRDVVSSMTDPLAAAHVGLPRPLLWTARQWRKSVAYKHQFEAIDRVKSVRYEDLASDPEPIISTWANWIGVNRPQDLTRISDQGGNDWSGNSGHLNHSGITTRSIGRHMNMSSSLKAFVEALCFAEMKALGYQPTIDKADVGHLIKAGPPEDFLDRPALANYAFSKPRVAEELHRWRTVTSPAGKFDPTAFIFEKNFQVLRQAVQS